MLDEYTVYLKHWLFQIYEQIQISDDTFNVITFTQWNQDSSTLSVEIISSE